MSAAARRRPAVSPARTPAHRPACTPTAGAVLVILLVVPGCSGPAGQEPSFAGQSAGTAAPSAALPALRYDGDAVTGLDLPWSVVVLDDGALLVAERETGEIKRYDGAAGRVIGTVTEAASAEGEGGLLGLAVPPGPDPDALYAYYTAAGDNRVARLAWDDGRLGPPEPVLTGIPAGNTHNGGRIAFGPDGRLYIGTGDAGTRANAQDPSSLGGKILRVTTDGAVPADNPAPGSPVYSLGHRNVQGLAWDSAGRLWATEFGPEVDDELNLIEPDGNYGWPDVTGAPGDARYVDAQVVWPSTASSSPSGMAIVDDVAYIGGLRGQRLWQVPLFDGTAGEPVSSFDGSYGRLRDVAALRNGDLLVATNEPGSARILRVRTG